jgi:uncharacterized protein YdaU (DUF1376 family)
MALRNQPYIPLYVNDFMSDEKLAECSAAATGVYIRIMCLMHKSEHYGKYELKAKHKQNVNTVLNFANSLNLKTPYGVEEIYNCLNELMDNKVIEIDGDYIIQRRMVKDGELSEKRAKAGTKGGKNVKNSHTRKLYNEEGFVYVIQDVKEVNVFKIGISKDPKKRLMALSCKLDKELVIQHVEQVEDMGLVEDNLLTAFNDHRDGEWIIGLNANTIISEIKKQKQITSKTKANSENEIEIENESSISSTSTNSYKRYVLIDDFTDQFRESEMFSNLKSFFGFTPEQMNEWLYEFVKFKKASVTPNDEFGNLIEHMRNWIAKKLEKQVTLETNGKRISDTQQHILSRAEQADRDFLAGKG